MHTIARGRLIKTREYRAFLDELALTFRSQYWEDTIECPVYVDIGVTVGPRVDGQNLIDPVLDALEQALVIKNDRQVEGLRLRVGRHPQKKEDSIRVYVTPVSGGEREA